MICRTMSVPRGRTGSGTGPITTWAVTTSGHTTRWGGITSDHIITWGAIMSGRTTTWGGTMSGHTTTGVIATFMGEMTVGEAATKMEEPMTESGRGRGTGTGNQGIEIAGGATTTGTRQDMGTNKMLLHPLSPRHHGASIHMIDQSIFDAPLGQNDSNSF